MAFVEPIVAAVWCEDEQKLVKCERCADCVCQLGYAFPDGNPNSFGVICRASKSNLKPVLVPNSEGHEVQL